MTYDDEVYELACSFKAETEKAVLIVDHASGEEMWIPLSQVKEMHKQPSKDANGTLGTIVITAWIAKKKGLMS